MKVKIPHTLILNIEEIPDFIQKDLKKSFKKCNFESFKHQLLKSSNIEDKLKLIEDLRQSLFSLDIKLEECFNILKGYKTEINSQKKEKE